MRRYLLYIVLPLMLCAGCTRGQWLDEIVAQRDEQEEVVPILLDAYDKGLFVTSVEVVERTNKYLHHSEYDRRYRMTFSDNNIVEIERGHPSDDKFYKKRGQAYISEILTSGEGGVEFSVWLPNEEWRQKYNHLVCEDGETVRFYFRIRSIDVISNIYYTSTDGNVVTPYATNVFGATIVSNTYENGQGVITFDGEVTSIGEYAFYGCSSLASITIPGSVTSIEDSAFFGCTSLASITIPEGVTSIGEWAFFYCTSLASVIIPDSVTSIGNGAFSDCSSLASVTIGNGVTSIGDESFCGCESLASITIPEGVTSIGQYAFYICSSLTSITIPESVTSIGNAAFRSCSSLAEFSGKFASEDGRCLIVDGVLKSFAIGCGLSKYTIPDSVTEIGEYAFNGCWRLASITIPDSVTSIGDSAFSGCTGLAIITIPDSVTSIGYDAFYRCSSLAEVYCKATTPPTAIIPDSSYGWGAFDDNASGRKIYVPAESVEAYKTAEWWSEYADAIVGYNF